VLPDRAREHLDDRTIGYERLEGLDDLRTGVRLDRVELTRLNAVMSDSVSGMNRKVTESR
jgi:hypothetical protein